MAAFTSSDVTISLDPRDRHILGKIKMAKCSIAFGNGVLTYTTGGVPMPAIGLFGMNKEVIGMNWLEGMGNSANGFIYKYDVTNRKILIYYADYDAVADGPLIELPNGNAPAAATLIAAVWGK
ncbi:MAG: hypothetical protein Q7J15_08050 [Candidatus Desulfaltia sp.]|nr:hypothetical protein [Candidatus Desulfaltia sp.]